MSGHIARVSSRVDLIGPGRLIMVVGPSGAGKDTLIGLAMAACAGDSNIVFPQRIVTRKPSVFENNESLTVAAFESARALGAYALHWKAHGHCYGVSIAIDDHIRAGQTVVVNASRGVIDLARHLYQNVTVVSIMAPPEVLAERLAARGRSSDGNLKDRLHREAKMVGVADATICNVGPPAAHGQELVRLIKGEDLVRE